MTAPAEPLKPSLEEARNLAALGRRIDELEVKCAALHRANQDLIDQLTGCRRSVAEQQDEMQAMRLRPNPRIPGPRTSDVPTGGRHRLDTTKEETP